MLPIRRDNVAFGECDSFEEVQKHINDLYRIARTQNTLIEKIMYPKKKQEPTIVERAKRLLLWFAVLAICITSVASASVPWNWEYGTNPDLLDAFMRNPQFKNIEMDTITLANGATIDNATNNAYEFNESSEELIFTFSTDSATWTSGTGIVTMGFDTIVPTANQFLFTPKADPVGTVEGTVYYHSDDDNLYVRTTAGWVDLTASASGVANLDEAYDGGGTGAGKAVTVDQGAIALTATDAANNVILALAQLDTATAKVMTITNAGTGNTIDIEGQAGGKDIEGTGDTWNVSGGGAGTFASLTTTAAGTIGTTLTVTGASVMNGNVDLGNATTDTVTVTGYIDADLSLDDGSGAPPQLIFRDGSDETAAFLKTLTGALTLTTQSDDGLNIAVGNLRVGDGTPGTAAMDGEDFYVKGASEFDSQATFDAVTVMNDWLDLNEELDVDMDASDETVTITTSAGDYAADSAIVTVNATAAGGATNNTYLLRLQHTADGDAQGHYLVLEDAAGTDIVVVNAGGTTTWALDAASYVKIDGDTTANTTTAGVLDLNVKSLTANNAAIYLDYEMDEGGSGTQYGLYLSLDDDATGGNETLDGIYITNLEGTASVVNGIVFANTLDTDIIATMPAAGKFATVDAKTTANTGIAGVIDASLQSATHNGRLIDLDVQMGNAGANDKVYGLVINLDDDDTASAGGEELIGVDVNAYDVTGNALIVAYHVSAADVALIADSGYVKLGTGTATVTQGDGDFYATGSIEGDDVANIAGILTLGSSLTMSNGLIMTNSPDTRLEITENSDTFGLIFGANKVELASCNGTGITEVDFNSVDQLTDVEYITGDNGQKIDFSHNELVEFGDTEKIGLILSGTNILELGTDTGLTTIDMNTVDNINDLESIQYDDDTLSKVMVTTVQLTAADVNALVGSPKQLIAAPGADYLIWPIEAVLILDAGSEVLVESADNLLIGWNNAAVQVGETIEMTTFIDQATDTITNWQNAKDEINAAAGIVNKNLALKNNGGDFTGNTSRDASMTVTVYYRIIKVGL